MTIDQAYPRQMHLSDELLRLAREVHHLQNQYKQEGPGDRTLHHLRKRADEAELRFEALLTRIEDEAVRRRWRDHLHYRGSAPDAPELPLRPRLLFRGRSEVGSVVEIYESDDGAREIVVDGAMLRRPCSGPPIVRQGRRSYAEIEGHRFLEEPAASDRALGALAQWAGRRRPEPPWEVAQELLEDGLVDVTFALTDRGRRILASAF